MKFGTAMKATRAGFHVRRADWDGAPDSMHESGIGPGLVWNDGGFVLEWDDIGFDDNRLSYTDLDADDWELTEPVDFGGALHLMHLGFYMRRQHWTGYTSLGLVTPEGGEVEFHHSGSSGDSHGFHPVADGLHDLEDFAGLTREDQFADDWVITSGEYIPKQPPVKVASKYASTVREAVLRLDPDVDSHWVMTGAHKGKPKLQSVEDAYGKAGLTRQDIEAAMPGYNRAKATEAALAT